MQTSVNPAAGPFAGQQRRLHDVLTDPARAQTAKDSAIRFEYAVRSFNEEAWKIRTRGFFLNANYGTSREKFDTFLGELRELRARKQDQIIQQACTDGIQARRWLVKK